VRNYLCHDSRILVRNFGTASQSATELIHAFPIRGHDRFAGEFGPVLPGHWGNV